MAASLAKTLFPTTLLLASSVLVSAQRGMIHVCGQVALFTKGSLPAVMSHPSPADTSVAGEWAVAFTTPQGRMEMTMAVTQDGTKLSGHLTSDIGEFPLKGTVDGDRVTIVWSFVERGKTLEITFRGKIEGDSISGTAQIGDVGEGPMSAERTGN
jgi:hypothetical protein